MSEKLTDGMSDNEINRFIHERVSKKCWHKPVRDKMRLGNVIICRKCKTDFPHAETLLDVQNPAYDSLTSPRQLLDEVVQKAVERFGMRDYIDSLGYVLTHEIDATKIEMSDAELGFLLLTAPPETICRAVRSLYEGEK